jgi:hypothetical protein
MAMHMMREDAPLMYYDTGTKNRVKATNEYLGNLLYFSDEGIEAMEATLYAIRRYEAAMEYGRQRVPADELAARRRAMDEALERVYRLLRRELMRPGGDSLKSGGSSLVSPAAETPSPTLTGEQQANTGPAAGR